MFSFLFPPFTPKLKSGEPLSVWIAVGESGISLLDFGNLKPIVTYDYSSVITFGGCESDFMLVVVGPESYEQSINGSIRSQKLLFSMSNRDAESV